MICFVTDSASQLSPTLAAEWGVAVVPITVTVDGQDYQEGVDLTPAQFWTRVGGTTLPEIATSQPSPGQFVDTYQRLADAGAHEIVSVHVGSEVSGTVNAARLAAEMVDVTIHVVDSGTASFGVSVCLWRAVQAVRSGADGSTAAHDATAFAPKIGTSFILQGMDFARAGGRLDDTLPDDVDDVVVLAGYGTALDVVGSGRTTDAVINALAAPFMANDAPVRAAVGLADDAMTELTDRLAARLESSDQVIEVLRYRITPSIASHTGPGTAGGFWWPDSKDS